MPRDNGRGSPADQHLISRNELLVETAKCTLALRDLGLRAGDRIVLNLPNIPAQRIWTEGAKSLDSVYTPVFGGFSEKALSDRIHDAGARIVITADGGYRNAQIVPFKSAYTDPALDNFVPVAAAHAVVAQRLSSNGTDATVAAVAAVVLAAIDDALAGEVSVLRGDVMPGAGRALADVSKRRARRIRRCRAAHGIRRSAGGHAPARGSRGRRPSHGAARSGLAS